MKVPFGKFHDQELCQLDTEYMLWLMSQSTFRSNHPAHRTELRWLLVRRLIDELPSEQVRKLYRKLDAKFAADLEGLV